MKLFALGIDRSNRRLKISFWIFFALGAGFSTYDLVVDILANLSFAHVMFQLLMSLVVFALTLFLFVNLLLVRIRIRALGQAIQLFRIKTGAVIERQFKDWLLSDAEKKVAINILRGYDFGQIADLLQKGERTVRTQAIAIYRKTGFRNRSEFTGFFFENVVMADNDHLE